MLVRLVAYCIMIVGVLDTGLYVTRCLEPKHPMPVKVIPIVLDSIPTVIGIIILIKAKALAAWLANKIE